MSTDPESVSAETSARESTPPRKLRAASTVLVLGALLLFSAAWSGWMAGERAGAALHAGSGLAFLAMALRPRLLFRRWNDTSAWPRPETAAERRLEIVIRVLIGAEVTAILLAALLKLCALV